MGKWEIKNMDPGKSENGEIQKKMRRKLAENDGTPRPEN